METLAAFCALALTVYVTLALLVGAASAAAPGN